MIGHEMVGEVISTDPSAKKVKTGDRVIIDQVTACGHCWACRHNRPNVCQNLAVRGVHIDGGYREYMAVPDTDCYVLPSSVHDHVVLSTDVFSETDKLADLVRETNNEHVRISDRLSDSIYLYSIVDGSLNRIVPEEEVS